MADQPLTVDLAIHEFTTSLWQAIGIVLLVSFVAVGVRAGTVVAVTIPLTLAVVFPMMAMADIDLQRISLGASHPAARRVNLDWMEPERVLRVRLDQDKARLLGLSSQAVATALNATISSTPITQVRDDIYLINVVARELGGQNLSLETLRTLPVAMPNGQTIPLAQFATFEPGSEGKDRNFNGLHRPWGSEDTAYKCRFLGGKLKKYKGSIKLRYSNWLPT